MAHLSEYIPVANREVDKYYATCGRGINGLSADMIGFPGLLDREGSDVVKLTINGIDELVTIDLRTSFLKRIESLGLVVEQDQHPLLYRVLVLYDVSVNSVEKINEKCTIYVFAYRQLSPRELLAGLGYNNIEAVCEETRVWNWRFQDWQEYMRDYAEHKQMFACLPKWCGVTQIEVFGLPLVEHSANPAHDMEDLAYKGRLGLAMAERMNPTAFYCMRSELVKIKQRQRQKDEQQKILDRYLAKR